ncbi:MAG TPA: hypothetical protein VNJ54_00805 [Plantibacter sp.]|uniref:hypothetical protein n=1 Tax=unclassified Plantibacter TaxID=2624265 RepID=UPI002B85970C|nr:hypothetical protein [Plantibacter sp.]
MTIPGPTQRARVRPCGARRNLDSEYVDDGTVASDTSRPWHAKVVGLQPLGR